MHGSKRCRLHGGKSLSGPASGTWKHGLYSRVLPTGLAAHYERARRNPALVTLTDQITLVDARLSQLLEKLAERDAPGAWRRLGEVSAGIQQAFEDFRAAQSIGSADRAARILAALERLDLLIPQLGEVVRAGATDAEAWKPINEQLSMRRKLVDSEVRRRKDLHEMLSRERALSMIAFIAESVSRHVVDVDQKQAVVNDMRRLLDGGPTPTR